MSWGVVMGVGARSNVLVSLHTNFFFSVTVRETEYGNSLEHADSFLSADFSIDLQNDTENKHSI